MFNDSVSGPNPSKSKKPSGHEKEQLLSILSNPAASESDWVKAAHNLGDYTHQPPKRKTTRKTVLTLLLLAGVAATGIFGYSNGWIPGLRPSAPAPVPAQVAEVDFNPYMTAMQRQIKSNWFPPEGDRTSGATLRWKLFKDGHLENLTVFKSSGNDEYDNACISAVEETTLEPLPAGAGDNVDIEFTFDYNVSGK